MHVYPVEVFAIDTDYGGIVHHASYLRFFEQGRTQWLQQKDPDYTTKYPENSVFLVVQKTTISYSHPGRLHDQLEVLTQAERGRPMILAFVQKIRHKTTQKTLVEATFDMVCVNKNMIPTRLPQQWR